eukprot:c16043_g1_i1.p1 GENE.c16043_g1_i1~~c16043_g1_i1.p1  ORF type:complete len:400 (+),score=96.29 c16043_g1_i1:231-1430(+)
MKSVEGISREYINGCNMQRCFNYSRCSVEKFGIYIYPEPSKSPIQMTDEYTKILSAIKSSPYHVTNPEQACIFVPGFDTLCLFNSCHQNPELSSRISHSLRSLSHWDGGRNHIVFDYSDFLTRYDVGMAILFKTSVPQRMYRHNFDVVLPLYARFTPSTSMSDEQNNWDFYFGFKNNKSDELVQINKSNKTKSQYVSQSESQKSSKLFESFDPEKLSNIRPSNQRRYLLSFKGSRYSNFGRIRNKIRILDNEDDIIIRTSCFLGISFDDDCKKDAERYNDYDYGELLENAKFGLVLPGVGEHSYRLLEVMQAGGIPVIMNDDGVLPLEGLINWRTISIQIPESQLSKVGPYLRSLNPNTIAAMQSNVLKAYQTYFISTQRYIQWGLELLKQRIWFYEER